MHPEDAVKARISVSLVYRYGEGEFDYNSVVRLTSTWEEDRVGYSQPRCFDAAIPVWRDRCGLRQFAAESLKENQSDSLHLKNETVKTLNQLTTFAEAVPEAAAESGSQLGLHKMGHPYEDTDMTKVLSRKYLLATIPWTNADTQGLDIAMLDIMEFLVEVPNIADKLTQFRWLAANAKLEVKMNATPMHIGSLMVSHIPRVKETTDLLDALNSSLGQKSQNHGTVISASTVNNMEFLVEREAPSLFDNVDSSVTQTTGCLGLLIITVLNPLTLATAGTVGPVSLSIFASFDNPKPAGFGWFPLSAASAKHGFKQQSSVSRDPMQAEALARAATSIVAGPEAKTLYESATKSQDSDTSVAGIVSQIVPAIQFAELLGLSKPANQTTPIPVYQDEYRDQNYTHGVANLAKFSRHPGAGLGTPPACSLRKNKLVDFITKPGLIYTGVITKLDTVGVPLFSTPVHPGLAWMESPTAETYVYSPTPMAYASQAFQFWRGDIRFMVEFITSAFVTARVRMTHWPASSIPPDLETHAGDAVSQVMDIRGDTSMPFTAAYVSTRPYQRCRGYTFIGTGGDQNYPFGDKNSYLTMSLVNIMTQPDLTQNAVIYYNVYAAAAPNMKFLNAIAPTVRTPSGQLPPGAVGFKQQSLVKRFEGSFPPLAPATHVQEAGIVSTEQFTTIEELCMWYMTYFSPTVAFPNSITTTLSRKNLAGNVIGAGDHLSFWAPCFRWNRGGLRYRLAGIPNGGAVAGSLVDSGGGQYPSFMSIADSRFKSTMDFEVEWPLGVPLNSFYDSGVGDDDDDITPPWIFDWIEMMGQDPGTPADVYRAAADDFMFGHQLAVPTYTATAEEPPASRTRRGTHPTIDPTSVQDTVGDVSHPQAGVAYATPRAALSSSPVAAPARKVTRGQETTVPSTAPNSPVLDQSTGLSQSTMTRLAAYLEDKGKLPLNPKGKP